MSNQDNTRAAAMLAPATANDIPALIRVHTAAFKSDLFSHLMLLQRPDDAHQILMQKSLDYWFADAHAQIIKAVDTKGEVVGWACWVLREATSDLVGKTEKADSSAALKQESGQDSAKSTVKTPLEKVKASSQKGVTPSGVQSTTQDPARALGALMGRETVRWEEKYLKGKKCLVLQALVTDPSCQGRGFGTQLVHWGTDKADIEDLPCWAHASPAGHSLYTKARFEEVGKSDFDLAEWAPGGKGGGRGWGIYTFRYMLRPAR
jgi:ribosomal protein S18 acetylase RimI-like enzyme